MKSSYTKRSETILKMKFVFSTFAYDFLLAPFKSGVIGFLIIFIIISVLRLFYIEDSRYSVFYTINVVHISLAGFLIGYAIKLFKNIDK